MLKDDILNIFDLQQRLFFLQILVTTDPQIQYKGTQVSALTWKTVQK